MIPGVSTSRTPNSPGRDHRRVDDLLQQAPLHHLEALALGRTGPQLAVVDIEPRQIEHAGHPGDHRDDVERLGPRDRATARNPIVMAVPAGNRLRSAGQIRHPLGCTVPGRARARAAPDRASAAMNAGVGVLRRDAEIARHAQPAPPARDSPRRAPPASRNAPRRRRSAPPARRPCHARPARSPPRCSARSSAAASRATGSRLPSPARPRPIRASTPATVCSICH